jgi:energy-converting hydrogenase Eha subunit C
MDLSWLLEPARMSFCEQTLPGLIKHPADTWTNIGPLLAGIATLILARRPLEKLLGFAALWTGVASAYFHASNTILGETLDLSGMFLFILSLAALQQFRATPQYGSTIWIWTACGLAFLLTILSTLSSVLASPIFAVFVVIVIIRGIWDRRLGPWAWAMVGTFVLAWGFWWLDYLHYLCIPGNHILTGHGMWHLLNGLVFWFAFLHFRNTISTDDGSGSGSTSAQPTV